MLHRLIIYLPSSSTIGPYFGDMEGNDWPHNPLYDEPSLLELKFNQYLMKAVNIMSNGTLENVSLIDLPALGSKIAQLLKSHRIEPNWPTELNFETLKNSHHENSLALFTEYKELLAEWTQYMTNLFQKDQEAIFTPAMRENKLFDFTKHIRADMKTFLIAVYGSHLNAGKYSHPIWKETAQLLFKEHMIDESVLSKRSDYDKLIMECDFGKNLLRRKDFDHTGGCELFQPTLTTNGLCHTFNGQSPSLVWKTAEITETFQKEFPMEHSNEKFIDAGVAEGKALRYKRYHIFILHI